MNLNFFQTPGQAVTHLFCFLDQLLHIVLTKVTMSGIVTSLDINSWLVF